MFFSVKKTVFFTEKRIRRALDTAPSNFKLVARDPVKSVAIGGDDFALAPGYGASFITSNDGQIVYSNIRLEFVNE